VRKVKRECSICRKPFTASETSKVLACLGCSLVLGERADSIVGDQVDTPPTPIMGNADALCPIHGFVPAVDSLLQLAADIKAHDDPDYSLCKTLLLRRILALAAVDACTPEDPCLDNNNCERCKTFPSGSGG